MCIYLYVYIDMCDILQPRHTPKIRQPQNNSAQESPVLDQEAGAEGLEIPVSSSKCQGREPLC